MAEGCLLMEILAAGVASPPSTTHTGIWEAYLCPSQHHGSGRARVP